MVQTEKNLPAVQETRIQPPGQGSLGEGTGNPLQWVLENSMDKELGELYNSWGPKESDTTERLSLSHRFWIVYEAIMMIHETPSQILEGRFIIVNTIQD